MVWLSAKSPETGIGHTSNACLLSHLMLFKGILHYDNWISVLLMCYCCIFSVYWRCLRCLMCAGIMLFHTLCLFKCSYLMWVKNSHLFRRIHLSTWWRVPPHWLPCSKDSRDCSSMNVMLHWYLIKQAAAPKCKKKDRDNSRKTKVQMISFNRQSYSPLL